MVILFWHWRHLKTSLISGYQLGVNFINSQPDFRVFSQLCLIFKKVIYFPNHFNIHFKFWGASIFQIKWSLKFQRFSILKAGTVATLPGVSPGRDGGGDAAAGGVDHEDRPGATGAGLRSQLPMSLGGVGRADFRRLRFLVDWVVDVVGFWESLGLMGFENLKTSGVSFLYDWPIKII